MEEKGAIVGGETSGHIILSKLSPTGDGLLVALFVLNILRETKKTLKDLTEGLETYKIVRENYPDFDEMTLKTSLIIWKKLVKSKKMKPLCFKMS